jgi:CDGSH-type Zn-finger protein
MKNLANFREDLFSRRNVLETKENVKFCGCSLSKDKPWCDGSHKAITGQGGTTAS